MNIIVICVPTPLTELGKVDFTFLNSAVESIANYAQEGTLVINESTSLPGTVRTILPGIVTSLQPQLILEYAVSPERIDPKNERWNLINTPRLVGGVTKEALQRATQFYESFCEQVIQVSSPEVAELAKLLENTYRLVNISLVNELVPLAQALEISMHEVVSAASTKPYGFSPFFPGVGIGGHCIPVDPVYLLEKAIQLDLSLDTVNSALQVNKKMLQFLLKKSNEFREICENRVVVLGISYKEGLADTRESAAVSLIESLKDDKWSTNWWDPLIENSEFKSSDYDSSNYLIIVTQKIKEFEIRDLISNAARVIDCTGQFAGKPNVVAL
jgi:UDP-N-acetyl-D-glucosamine dehydrogenase